MYFKCPQCDSAEFCREREPDGRLWICATAGCDYVFPSEPPFNKSGHPAFHAILAEMAALHDKKAADYGGNDDPLRNLRRGGEAINVEAWKAAFSRMGDKFGRIEQFIKKGKLENEGVEDSFKDIAVYAILSLILFREVSK